MPLRYRVQDEGRTGIPLRRHRGDHELLGTGQCRRLAKILPVLCQDSGTAALVPDLLSDYLAEPLLVPADDLITVKIFRYKFGIQRKGVALDKALMAITSDNPRPESVLRAQLRVAAASPGH